MKLSMYGPYKDDTSDPEKFKAYESKIKAYREKLSAGVLDEYKLPDELIPKDLEAGVNVTEFAKKILSDKEVTITEITGTDLAEKIAKGEYTSVEVFKAYAKRATVAHQLTNCAMELFIDEGLKRAKELDEYYAKTGKTVGILHGVPVSLKEHYNYKGKVTHCGFVSRIENVADNWSLTVELLKDAGAVFYVRTTQPQCLMHLCSENNITGICRNPSNTSLTPGGSSSGEGAIAAMKGSVFGVGSDIGGSIRSPAAFCGVWGLRPSQKRVSLKNCAVPGEDGYQEIVVCVIGPLARSAEDLELFMKVAVNGGPWKKDAAPLPMPWRDVPVPDVKKLKIAITYDDGVVKPTPPIARALKHAAKKLQAAGATVVEWKPINVQELVEACCTSYNADGNLAQKSTLAESGEPIVKLTQNALSFGCGDKGISAAESQILSGIREKGRQDYLDKLNDEAIDFILSPTYVSVAPKPKTVRYWGYTNLWNILDYPNVIFPSGLSVDPKLDAVDTTFKSRNEYEEYEYSLYTGPEDFVDAPIALQLTGRRYNDEEVVKASSVLAKVIRD